ncbi:MAG TPA: peptidase domain-containing ABC transporter [Planctomycetota bacterium]|nr:peptidase domain-containing ABC transporter [Planctomycetota bacterium]
MRFPCVRNQHDHNDCGPAVIATVAKYHGLDLSLGRVREACKTDAIGTNLYGLMVAAESLGFDSKAARVQTGVDPWPVLKKCPPPFIVHVVVPMPGLATTNEMMGHFWVVFKISDKHVDIADPAQGLRRVTKEEFLKAWTGELMLLVPTPRLAGIKPSAPSWRRFLGLLSGRWSLFIESVIAAILFAALGLGTSFYVQHLVDSVLLHGRLRLLHLASAGVMLLAVFRVGFHVIERYLLVHLSQKIDVALTMEYYQHILRLPLGFFEARRTGEILARLNDAHKIRQAISGTILASVVDLFFVVAAGGVMFIYDWRLAVFTLSAVPIFLLVVFAHRDAIRKQQRKVMEESADLQAHLVEVVAGNAAVKAARAEEHVRQGAESRLVRMVRTTFRLAMLGVSTDSLCMLLTSMSGIGVLWFGGTLVIKGELTVGQLLFFNSLLAHLLEPLTRLANANVELEDAMIAADRVGEILELKPEQPLGSEKLRPKQIKGELVLDNVKFRYGFRDWVLDGITIEIPAGHTVALVGASGSGKTTIGKLTARFYDPTEGRILLDGHDLRDVDVHWYRERIGVVDQECMVFSHSVKDNIRLGKTHATLEEVERAAKAAGAHEFIEKLPERYDTLVGERGSNLSGGQRQRLAIARAILGDPKILILDEATSHLDSETERAVQKTLREVTRERTTIIIAHRLSTVMMADTIYVLDKGKVVEEGAHEDLIANDGPYREMWLQQVPASMLMSKTSGRRVLDDDVLRSGDFIVYDDSQEAMLEDSEADA